MRFRVPVIDALPTPSVERQGELWRLRATPGALHICLQNDLGDYAWIPLVGIDADLQATLARIDPGTAGTAGQALMRGPSGPVWTDTTWSIAWFGAVRDNAAIDNIAAIDTAISTVAALGGGTVYVPRGTWYVKPGSLAAARWILLRSNVTLWIDPGATIKVRDDTGDWGYLFHQPSGLIENARITGGGTINLNPTGNTSASVVGGDSDALQCGIRLGNFAGVTIEDITMIGGGVWNIYAAGATNCRDLTIRNTRHTFDRAPSAGWFDTTVIYTTVEYGAVLHGNYGRTTIADHAATFLEAHGHGLTVTSNTSDSFLYVAHVTPHSTAPATHGQNLTTVIGNVGLRCNYGIALNALTGTLRDVIVASNALYVAQLDHGQSRAAGIHFMYDADETGDYERIQITDNLIVFQAGDTRAIQYADTWGVGLKAFGDIRDVRIAGNLIANAPTASIWAGRDGSAQIVAGVQIVNNLLVDGGGNTSAFDVQRSAVVLTGTLIDVLVANNTIRDTGNPRIGRFAVASVAVASTTRTSARDNTIQCADSTLINAIDRTAISDRRAFVLLDWPSIPAGGSASQTVSVLGATAEDAVTATPAQGLETGLVMAWAAVTASETVTIRLTNTTGSAINPGARYWHVTIHNLDSA